MGPLQNVNKTAKHARNTRAAPPANWVVLWSTVDVPACRGLMEHHPAAQGNAPGATIAATLVSLQVRTGAQAATQRQTSDN